jgi:hypothetical protein
MARVITTSDRFGTDTLIFDSLEALREAVRDCGYDPDSIEDGDWAELADVLGDCDDPAASVVEWCNDPAADIAGEGIWYNGHWAADDEIIQYLAWRARQ